MMRLRVLLYGVNFSPEIVGIGKYTGELAYWLASRGHLVTAVVAPPYYPKWSIAHGWKRLCFHHDRVATVNVKRCPIWVPARPSGMARLFHMASYVFASGPV